MNQALYRKYRSRSLSEVVGQEHITNTLANALKAGRIAHAYLLTGPRGTGKTSIARILAHEINKLPYSDKTHLDIIEIDAASNRRIDDIRDLREKVHVSPVSATYKIYIIDEVHMLTGESFNALLKTLEEPPAHVVFILATTEVHKLPATIISRTQRFSLRPAEPAKVANHLKHIATAEGIKISDEALTLLAEHGEGSFRDSISMLDQMASTNPQGIEAADVRSTIGLADNNLVLAIVNGLTSKNSEQIASSLENASDLGVTLGALTNQICKALAEQAPSQPQFYNLIDELLDVPRAYNPKLKLLAKLLGFAAQGKPSKTVAETVTQIVATTTSEPIIKRPAQPKKTAEPTEQHMGSLNDADWQKVIDRVKQVNIPLHSVLKHATPDLDPDSQSLNLAFKYQLHRKKLDDAKQRAALSQIIAAVLGVSVQVATSIQTNEAKTSSDSDIAAVAAIMGGGEVVDANE